MLLFGRSQCLTALHFFSLFPVRPMHGFAPFSASSAAGLVASLNGSIVAKWKNIQNFVLKVYIVITSKVFADFCFESPISIDFQSEILALLRPKSLQTLEVITIQNFKYFLLKVKFTFGTTLWLVWSIVKINELVMIQIRIIWIINILIIIILK